MRVIALLAVGWLCASGQTFEVASIKPVASERGVVCSGGPGTADPGMWRCSNVPLAFLMSYAYGFQAYQFPPFSSCCQARFDYIARVPAGTTREQFQAMLRNLLAERFKLKYHLEQKEMPVYELAAANGGPKMKEAGPGAAPSQDYPWVVPKFRMGDDGYPEFPDGRGGLQGMNGHYRWVGFGVSMEELVKTLSFHLGRPVVDATGLEGRYDIDLRWGIDMAWLLERSGRADEVGPLPDTGPQGPPLVRAVQDLGLKLVSRKGPGDVVVVDHVEKVPTEN